MQTCVGSSGTSFVAESIQIQSDIVGWQADWMKTQREEQKADNIWWSSQQTDNHLIQNWGKSVTDSVSLSLQSQLCLFFFSAAPQLMMETNV